MRLYNLGMRILARDGTKLRDAAALADGYCCRASGGLTAGVTDR